MAYNFFGTFTKAQWDDFKDFTVVQREELGARLTWLKAEIARTGQVSCVYDDDNMTPISFTAAPRTYIGKLLLAYRMLGGVPENDMLLRIRDKPVFLHRGVDMSSSPSYSNGRLDRGSQRFDRSLGLAVEALKKWQLEVIKSKREHLEFKIKRAMDYADQLQQEYDMIDGLINGFVIDEQIVDVETTMFEPGRMNVPIREGDRHGLQIGNIVDPTMVDAVEVAASGHQRGGHGGL
jgi:hypothetical protein